MVKKSNHDALVDLVEEELRNRGYDRISKLLAYETRKSKDKINGELDVFALKDDYALVFEIKATNTPKQMNKQQS